MQEDWTHLWWIFKRKKNTCPQLSLESAASYMQTFILLSVPFAVSVAATMDLSSERPLSSIAVFNYN